MSSQSAGRHAVRFRVGELFVVRVQVLALAAIIAACPAGLGDRSLERARRGPLVIGYAVEAPYAFVDLTGRVTGEAPEIARIVLTELEIRDVRWRLTSFDRLLDELQAGLVDVVAAGLFITPERAGRVAFSRPTAHVQQGLLVAPGNPRALHSYQQLAAEPGVRTAVVAGSVEALLLQRLGAQVVTVPDALVGRVEVETGAVDALALSAPTLRWLARESHLGSCVVAEPFSQLPDAEVGARGYAAFAFRHADRALRLAWDERLASFVGSEWHLRLVADLGFSPAELPIDITAEDVLGASH